jgi:methylated-DNA-[protein]-cysteine S-methyltransferase
MNYCYVDSSIGPLLVAGDEHIVRSISFPRKGKPQPPGKGWVESARGALGMAKRQLREYFAGRRADFDFPIEPQGTPFQLAVWGCMLDIPYGQTVSYGELARRVGSPRAARAVGSANRVNPLSIVIPCHRVIAGDGTLGGYGDAGLKMKQKLLALEAAALKRVQRRPSSIAARSCS